MRWTSADEAQPNGPATAKRRRWSSAIIEAAADAVIDARTPIFFARVEGAASMLHVFEPAPSTDSVVAIAARVTTDALGVERWAFYTLDTAALREVETFVGSLADRVSETRWKPVCCP